MQQLENQHHLTPREAQCCSLMAQGLRNKQIADQMQVSLKTVDAYLDKIKTKLRCRNKMALIAKMVNP